MRVALLTANHEFVVAGVIPPFLTAPPTVLFWGQRVFRLNGWIHVGSPDQYAEYLEAFAVTLVNTDGPQPPNWFKSKFYENTAL